ncbi:MAG: rhodanese-like domain-containing protein [Sedimenticola sp.]|uniref:Rhodanese-like domain-containing protein n=1 Tax=Sedimenticola thiotaurini TaxID=1543721 RepID=A0A558CSZ3_9GAMM|nr:rhodanese-like domain-containing protein [Sedimenticola sp.]MCW8948140.1 rhodanese-like domain-containing protein [Sedimenticola sp.]MCW8949507.1 rhodanese-like domain-containing protein [Sedimenticola sp.]MCW8976502.1 rhodanese-like domain-containing protein [Sedimenticola sp.]TVT51866.1 MAG: rhodanese-like domain-containing protein [Sedimenticola thiotaurini]
MKTILSVFALLLFYTSTAIALDVQITRDIAEFQVTHGTKQITVKRKQDRASTITSDFALTSRPCPPFCAQPMQVAPGVVTVGEVELVAFMKNQLADGSGILIDARTPDWHARGTIPGSINIPFTHLNPGQGADDITLGDALVRLGVVENDNGWDFSKAKQLVLWCNGPWCGQSPTAIKGLLSIGFPAEKLFYYRGGMQVWQIFGLPIVTPDGQLIEE